MRLGVRSIVVVIAATAAAVTPRTAASQASLSRNGHSPITVRTALALGAARTTVWTQVHATSEAGAFALVVPAAPGAAVDLATDAWLEAAEAATAVRISPPSGIDATCPGSTDEPIHVAGDLAHHATLLPAEIDVVVGAGELLLWAAERQLEVPGPVAQAFAASDASHFVALRFAAPASEVWTPTVRVALPGAMPTVPLALVHAEASPIAVTLFTFGAGRPLLPGPEVAVDPAGLELDAATRTSDYLAARSTALAPAGAWLVEAAGHAPLVSELALPDGTRVPALVEEYLARAAAYGATGEDPTACAAIAVDAIEQDATVGVACARGDAAVVEGGAACVEAPAPDETDPALLRCGSDVDDLALALSGLSGPDAWIGRVAMQIAPGDGGVDQAVGVSDGPAVEPSLEAGGVDLSGCGEGGAGGGGGEGGQTGASATGPTSGSGPGGATPPTTGPSSGSGTTYVEVPVRVYDVACGCSGEYVIVDYVEVAESDVPEDGSYYADEGDDCGGDSTGSYDTDEVEEAPPEDDCGGESSDSAADDDCGGDTSETAESSSSGDDGCSGDTTDTSGDDGGDDGGDSTDDGGDDGGDDGADDGGESGGDSGCGCDESAVAAAAGRVRHRAGPRRLVARPRLSVVTLGLVALLAPLRRLTRPRRRPSR